MRLLAMKAASNGCRVEKAVVEPNADLTPEVDCIAEKRRGSDKMSPLPIKPSIVIFASTLAVFASEGHSEISNVSNGLLISGVQDPGQAAVDYFSGLTVSQMNEAASDFMFGIAGDDLKFLEFSFGVEEENVILEGVGVYRLHETRNWFVFNQSSFVGYGDRQTFNTGLGVRHINDSDTIILGANAFHDFEFGSEHRRVGVGAEVLTSMFQLRANYYKALTEEIEYKGVQEAALDGHDIKLTYELPYFYSSNLFVSDEQWYDGADYRVSSTKWGAAAEIAPNLIVTLAGESDSAGTSDMSASVSYQIRFGEKPSSRVKRDGVFKFELDSVRHMLYQPVQRENRIMKKSAKIGVTVSGY